MAKIVTRDDQYANPLDQLISLPSDETTADARSAAFGREASDETDKQ